MAAAVMWIIRGIGIAAPFVGRLVTWLNVQRVIAFALGLLGIQTSIELAKQDVPGKIARTASAVLTAGQRTAEATSNVAQGIKTLTDPLAANSPANNKGTNWLPLAAIGLVALLVLGRR